MSTSDIASSSGSQSANSTLDNVPVMAGQYGLIMIKCSDPISWFSNIISDIDYTHIGFYYKTKDTSLISHNVIVKNIFTCSTPEWCNNITLDQLLVSPLVDNIVIRPMIDISELPAMRSYVVNTIIELISYDSVTMRVVFNTLFNNDDKIIAPLFAIINRKILDMTIKYYSYINPNAVVDQDININVNKVIISPLWSTSITLPLQQFKQEQIATARADCYHESQDIMNELGQLLIELLFNEPHLIKLIEERRKGKLRDKHIKQFSSLVSLISDCISESYLNVGDLNTLLTTINNNLEQDNIPLQCTITQYDRSKLVFIDSSNSSNSSSGSSGSSSSSNSDAYQHYKQTIERLGNELKIMRKCVNSDSKRLSVDVNSLFRLYNELQQITNIGEPIRELSGEYSTNISVVIKEETSNGNNLTFRYDDKIITIHSRYYDLTTFSDEVLLQVLVAIDNQISDDNYDVFDDLRMAIIRRLY